MADKRDHGDVRAMDPRSRERDHIRGDTAGYLLAAGLTSALPLWALTNAAARSTIGGPSWSLNGNGALGILVPGAMAVLAGGWTALATPAGRTPRGVVGAVAAVSALALGIVWTFGGLLLAEPLHWMAGPPGLALLALLAGVVAARLAGPLAAGPLRIAVAAGLAVIAGAIVEPGVIFALGWLLLPLLIALPLLVATARRRSVGPLVMAALALPVGLLVGVIALSAAFGLG